MENHNALKEFLLCPISGQIFNEPVTLSDGHTYEKELIEKYLSSNNRSPITKEILNDDINNLQINYLILQQIDYLLEKKIISKNDIYEKEIIINSEFFKKNNSNPKLIKDTIDLLELRGELEKVYSDYDNYKLIHFVCEFSTLEIVKYLVDKGVDLEFKNYNKETPLHIACEVSTPEIIKYLIDKGVDLETKNYNEWKPIHLACRHQNYDVVKLLIDKGVDLESVNEYGYKPIHYACIKSDLKIIKLLVNKGINLNAQTNDGTTPFEIVCKKSDYKIIKYFRNKLHNKKINIDKPKIKSVLGKRTLDDINLVDDLI